MIKHGLLGILAYFLCSCELFMCIHLKIVQQDRFRITINMKTHSRRLRHFRGSRICIFSHIKSDLYIKYHFIHSVTLNSLLACYVYFLYSRLYMSSSFQSPSHRTMSEFLVEVDCHEMHTNVP